MGQEIELKFLLPDTEPAFINALEPVRRRALGQATTMRLLSTYYDTPNLDLRRQHIAFRIRSAGSDWIQTVKSKGVTRNGIVSREEIEHLLPGNQPDFTKLAGTSFEKIFTDKALLEALRPCFTTDFMRTAWQLRGDRGQVELALDKGSILAGGKSLPLFEIELELKDGDSEAILQIAGELAAHLELEQSTVNKAQRGYSLIED